MANFIRRFLSDPGNETLLEIESVNVLDLEPPASIQGIGVGTALLVAEFEDGPFADAEGPQEVASAGDFKSRFGSFGYTYDGVSAQNPSARARKADGALNAEYWNGNGFLALVNKKFKRLVVARVDTSVGEVEFTRKAALIGSTASTFDLGGTGKTLIYDLVDGVAPVTKTFTGAVAVYTSGAGVYPTLFTGGEQLVLKIDGNTDQELNVTVTFLVGDQLRADVISRINAACGYTCAVANGGAAIDFSGRVLGTSGNVSIVSATASVLAALNIAVSTTYGTGNVGNCAAVTVAEVDAVIGTDIGADRDANGALRISNNVDGGTGKLLFTSASTALSGLGLTADLVSDAAKGYARLASTAMTIPTLFAGGETVTLGVDDGPNILVTFLVGDQTRDDVINRINATLGATVVSAIDATHVLYSGAKNGGQFRVVSASAAGVLTKLGLTAPRTIDADPNANGTIPAGTRVENSSAVQWVTMQSVAVTSDDAGPYSVKVRPATDDGTTLTTVPASVTVMPYPISVAAFDVTNPLALSAALTESQIDAAYVDALDSTLALNNVASTASIVWSARQSHAVRNGLKQNALDASANGCYGRMAVIRPPLGTTRSLAKSGVQPGVASYRNQRVIYAYPGVSTFVSQVAALGTAGGDGFTGDGVLDLGFDGFVASVLSQLNPEENPGQETTFLTGVVAIESGNADVQNMAMADYIAFKAAGIVAPRIDSGTTYIQSGVTSVDPAVYPNLKNIARRRMADFIQDTLSRRLKSFGKRLNTRARRIAITQEVRAFLDGLVKDERIEGFVLDPKSGNTADTLAAGLFRLITKVRTISSLDSIVLESTVGESVDISEAA